MYESHEGYMIRRLKEDAEAQLRASHKKAEPIDKIFEILCRIEQKLDDMEKCLK